MDIDFQRTIIFGVTPNRRCVGIKIFPAPLQMDENENTSIELEDYVDRCVEQAIKLKQEVDCGLCAVEENEKIDLYPSTGYVDAEYIIRSRVKQISDNLAIKSENLFIDLSRTLIRAFYIGNIQFDVIQICFKEIIQLTKPPNKLTPLMLKKNSQFIHCIGKMRFFAISKDGLHDPVKMGQQNQIRRLAEQTLSAFKRVMEFCGNNDAFLLWFLDTVTLFHELTANMTDDERRRLTTDPENLVKHQIV